MAATVLRVKRRLDESPLEALVLHCKRAKLDDVTPAVFYFSGTADDQDESPAHIKKSWLLNRDKVPSLSAGKDIPALVSRLKDKHREEVQSNRLKIVNCSRGLSVLQEDVGAGDSGEYALLNLHWEEDKPDGGSKEQTSEKKGEAKFAYDIYLSGKKAFDSALIDDIIRIDPYHGELMFDGECASSDHDNEDSDSNAEDYWRNDYPDTESDREDSSGRSEDSDGSIQEKHMLRAMARCQIEDDLSSEDEDHLYGYSVKEITANGLILNRKDINRYGLNYAKYKARVLQEKGDQELDDNAANQVEDHKSSSEG